MDPISALIGLFGTIAGGGLALTGQQAQANAAKTASQNELDMHKMTLDWQREAAGMAQDATEEENRRRQIEAAFRAGKLEDVVKMFQGLQGPGTTAGMSTPGSINVGDVSAGSVGWERLGSQQIGAMSGLQQLLGQIDPSALSNMVRGGAGPDIRGIRNAAAEMASRSDAANLRRTASRELDAGSEQMAALMAQQGLTGSGYAGTQQRALAGQTMSGLSQAIAENRRANLMGAGQLFGQSGGLDINRRTGAANAAISGAGTGFQGMGLDLNRLTANQQAALQAGLANQSTGLSAGQFNVGNALQAALANQQMGFNTQSQNIANLMNADQFNANLAWNQAQAGSQFDMSRLAQIAGIYGDAAFGANAPLPEGYGVQPGGANDFDTTAVQRDPNDWMSLLEGFSGNAYDPTTGRNL